MSEHEHRQDGHISPSRSHATDGMAAGAGVPVPDDASDVALVVAMACGQESAAARLYDRYGPLVFAVAHRITGSVHEADDVVAESLAQAWWQAARFDGARGQVAAWLVGIARSRALDLVRTRGRRERRVTADSGTVDATPTPSGEPDALALVESAERDTAVTRALAALPVAQREAITLAFFEGLTHAEIASRSGTPVGTVKTRIRLGMQKLRDLLVAAHGKAG